MKNKLEITFIGSLFFIALFYFYLHFMVTNTDNEQYLYKKKLKIVLTNNNIENQMPTVLANEKLPTMYVLTTGVRKFDPLAGCETITVIGQKQTNTVAPTFDEGYGPRKWPDGARGVTNGHVTIWRKIAAECSGWCFVSEDDAIWPNGIPSELPSDGFVSFFKEAVCAQATGAYSENYDSVVKVVVPGKCMPYGAVAYAITGDFAKMLLSKLPMSKPVDHFLWEQAVVHKKAYVSRRYVVRHKKGKSLRQHAPVAMLSKNPEYVQGTGISDEYGGTESAKHKKGRRQSVTLSTITEFGRECQKVYSGIGPDSLCNGIVPIDNPYMKSIGHGLNLSGSGRAFLSKPMRFSDFEFSCYSQTTEDGVLLSILESIGVTNRRAVEIAGGVGWENNLANLVINFGFETLFFDGDPGNVRCARNFFDHHPSTRHHPPVFADDFVSAENINSLIKSKGWSGPIDVFSLDIDGVDYWIWDAIEIIQPRVVVVEIQELWGPEERWTRPYNSNFHSDGIPSMGASLAAFDYLARKKGYRLVGCVKAGFNAFFVSESAANLDDIFGSGSYDRSGCFAHVDQHWRTVLDNRREKASKYSWVDPKTGKYLSNSNTVTDPTLQPLQTIPTSVEHYFSKKSTGKLLKTIISDNINEVAKECSETDHCDVFEKFSKNKYNLISGLSMVEGSFELFKMTSEPACSTSISPDVSLLIPSSGRQILCDTLKSIECHSSYLTHCPDGPNVFIQGGVVCHDISQKCIEYVEKGTYNLVKSHGVASERQRQTSDFVSILKAVQRPNVLIIDDDFIWCSQYVKYIQSAFQNNFRITFLGQGSNGMLMNNRDVNGLIAYMSKHITQNNVDLLMYQYAGSLRECIARSEVRLARHKGMSSSFKHVNNLGKWIDDNFCGMPMLPKHVKHAYGTTWNEFYDDMWRTNGCGSKKTSESKFVETNNPHALSCSDAQTPIKIQWTNNTCTDYPFDMAVHSIPDIVSHSIIKYGCWEKDIISQIVEHLSESDSKLFLDVGANIGAFTSSIASLGHEVIAIEPFKLNVPLIQKTICKHNYNVHLYKVGLSDTSPGEKMCVWSTNSKINNGNARIVPFFEGKKDFGADKQKECMEVIYTYTLDELLFDTFKLDKPIGAMKIDIEGFETRAFRGAKKLLSSEFKPQKIWFEFQKDVTMQTGASPTELFDRLTSHGYKITDFRKSDVPLSRKDWNKITMGDFMAVLSDNKINQNDIVKVEKSVSIVSKEANLPKIIHMTGRGSPNKEFRSWKEKNPEWDARWYSDDDVNQYVIQHYPEYLTTWQKMSKIAKFDFWRILVVYKEGGLYVDSDVTCNRPISDWDIQPTDKFVSGTECWGCNDIELQLIQFAFMAVPEHPVLKYAAVHIATNAWRRPSYAHHYENSMKNVFHSSGPGALTHGLLQYLFSKKHSPECVTPYGRCEDVNVMPWWWWGYMDQHSEDHPATPKPLNNGGHYFLHGFRASWTHDKINTDATTTIITEKIHVPKGKFAYVFFATSAQHACAVDTMVHRLIQLGSEDTADFVCVVPHGEIHFNNERIKTVVHKEVNVQHNYFKFAMIKLYGFQMYDYDRVIHMDVDSYVQKNLDHLFLLPDVPLAAPVANWENEFCISGALLIIKPDKNIWQTKIQPNIATYAKSGKSEMNLLNEVFQHRINSNRILPELLILPSKYLTLSTEFTHPEPYHKDPAKLWEDTVIFHFSGGYGKPWAPQNVDNMNDATRKLYDLYKSNNQCLNHQASKSIPKIAVAIPTYNRAGYVQLCAAALTKTIDPNNVWIFDDHSTEYTAGDLQEWFHTENVQQNTERFKADKQARHILEWFVGTDYDWLITLDSDLIVRPDWLELLRGMLSHTQGVMSLYHSGNPNHPTLHCDPHLCEMKSLGNAGVAWSKVLAKRMLVDMTQSDGFDWGWTEWLQKQKIPQYVAKDSLVLHVGMHGTWGADSKREKSVGFPMHELSNDVRQKADIFLKGINP